MKTLRFLSLLIGITGTLHAQKAEPPPLPSGPLINRAPDFAQWSITTISGLATKTEGKSKPSEFDMQTVVTKTKTIYYIQKVDGLGAKTEKWSKDGFQVIIDPKTPFPITAAPGMSGGDYYTDFSKSDFSGFDWISRHNYVGVEKVAGNDCYIFKSNIKATAEMHIPGASEDREQKLDSVASIDVKTRLPISLQLGTFTYTYQYGKAPTAMLVPPANVTELSEKWQHRLKQAAMMPPP